MNNKVAVKETPYRTITLGIEALREKLGAIGVAEFFEYFGLGYGDYTKEKYQLFQGITVDDICSEIQADRGKNDEDGK